MNIEYRDRPFHNNGVIIDFPNDPDSASFKSKQKVTVQTGNNGTKDIQIMVPLKYGKHWNLENFWSVIN